MYQLSAYKHDIVSRALKLGFDRSNPSQNVSFPVIIMDVNEDGAKTVQTRRISYGTTKPSPRDHTTIWLRSDNHKIYRFDFTDTMIEETHISDLHESNY